MIIVVNDANILIDLVKLQLVEPFFAFPGNFTPPALFWKMNYMTIRN